MALTRHSGEWTIEDKCESPWHYLPVEVPPASSALRVDLEYRGVGLDLGGFGPAGCRGWSGGARRSFTITAASATPGYLAGELEPGTWQVVIGLHRIPLAGVRYQLTAQPSSAVLVTSGEPPPDPAAPLADRPPRRNLPAAAGMTWLAGDLHAHTVHSDG